MSSDVGMTCVRSARAHSERVGRGPRPRVCAARGRRAARITRARAGGIAVGHEVTGLRYRRHLTERGPQSPIRPQPRRGRRQATTGRGRPRSEPDTPDTGYATAARQGRLSRRRVPTRDPECPPRSVAARRPSHARRCPRAGSTLYRASAFAIAACVSSHNACANTSPLSSLASVGSPLTPSGE